ncbi:MAG: hypothetical protein A2539_10600 [Elusimicrobia bacterium RIFOXYD2_FULL_34_15]|nr:MAG: hypothetical protein A2539_10600 [Elusimicrobia bacterium RIFOXYD2_FULL_34_15]
MKILNKLSFKFKLISIILIVNIVISSLTMMLLHNKIKKTIIQKIGLRTNTIVNIISTSAKIEDIYLLFSNDKKQITQYLERYSKEILNEPEIEYVAFYGKNEEALSLVGSLPDKKFNFESDDINNLNNSTYNVSKDIFSEEGNIIGHIMVGFSIQNIDSALKENANISFKLLIFSFLIISLIIYVVLTYFLKPLQLLYQASTNVVNKNFDCYVPVSSNDEIGKISEQFNIMVKELKSFYSGLEKKVKAATSELHVSNKELQEQTIKLMKINLQLKEMDEKKSEFVSVVAHDLRTPLTSILGFAETIMKTELKLTEEQKSKYLIIIQQESRRLGRLISDFLDLSKIEEGRIHLKFKKVNFNELVERTVETFRINNNKNINFVIETDSNIAEINLDPDRISQVLQNILSNAMKYSPSNSAINILLKQYYNFVKISVSDFGMGIPNEEKEKVFQKFYRIDNDISRKERGSGLGLTISKAIIELHCGRIWVEDNIPNGSVFIFTLPIRNFDEYKI